MTTTYTSAVQTGDLEITIINHSQEHGTYESGVLSLPTASDLGRNMDHFAKIGWRVYAI